MRAIITANGASRERNLPVNKQRVYYAYVIPDQPFDGWLPLAQHVADGLLSDQKAKAMLDYLTLALTALDVELPEGNVNVYARNDAAWQLRVGNVIGTFAQRHGVYLTKVMLLP